MQLPAWLTEFWTANSGNVIVSLIIGFVFFVLGPLGLWFSGRRIRQERVRKAKDALLDILEGMLVSQETIDEQKLSLLFRAVARDIDVNLGTSYDVENLLEDVVLRFEKSKHLDAAQKDKYANEVQRLFQEMKPTPESPKERVIPRPYRKIIDDLKEVLSQNDQASANKIVSELEERLIGETTGGGSSMIGLLGVYRRLYERNPILFIVLSIIVIAVYVVFIFSYLLR